MAAQDTAAPYRGGSTGRARRWLSPGYAAALAAVTVLLVSGVLIGRSTLAASVTALTSLNWGWILFATGCEVISLVAWGLSRRRLLRADGHRAGFGSVMAVTCASNALSMTIPFAGVQLALVFCYREFRRRGLGSAITGWALAVSAILSTGALALMLVAGAIAGGVSVATALGLAGAAIFLVPATTVLLALRYQQIRRTLDRLLAKIITGSHRLFRWPGEGAARTLENMLDRVARIRLPWPRYAEVFALSVLNWAADCGCLAGTIRATGSQVPWHGLLLAYAAGAAVGSAGAHPGRLRPGGGNADGRAGGVGPDRPRGARGGARLPADQLLDDHDRRMGADGRPDPASTGAPLPVRRRAGRTAPGGSADGHDPCRQDSR